MRCNRMNQILQMEAELLLGSPGNEDILCVVTAVVEVAHARRRNNYRRSMVPRSKLRCVEAGGKG